MAKKLQPKTPGKRQVLVHYDQALPEIVDRQADELPSSYLEKDGNGGYRIIPGRRPSKLLLVSKIRQVVDAWRANGYKGVSDTTRRLLEYWFGSSHRLNDGLEFCYYFGQREAIEALIYLREVKHITDSADLILSYMDETAYGNDIFVTRKQIVEDIRGKRRLQRLVPDTGQMADQAIPPEKLPRYATKMATGSGKTVVMALAITWSYFHCRFEQSSDMARHFLMLAPNIIVYERLKIDFEDEKIFRELPIIPPEWKYEWDFRTVLRGESYSGSAWSTLYLTNIQQFYDRGNDDPINPIDMVLGPRVKGADTVKSASIMDMVQKHDDLMIINDEAHHVHDEDLEWWKIIETLHAALIKRTGHGLIAQLDFSATPKDRNGTFFPWIISDYPLAQAVEDRIVKAPLVVHQTERETPQKYTNAAVAYQEWIQIALKRWRVHHDAYKPIGIKPVLFVMAEDTYDADIIAESIRRESDIKDDEVLVIHVKEKGKSKGEITELDLGKAREAARSIDLPGNKIKVVVSVLMLREGWDVRNVTVILGLRPFSSDANILPEQAVGRGLRLMRNMHPDYAQVVEIVGTPKFEEFVKGLEIEGVGVGSTKTPPNPGVPIYPMKERAKYDIEIPQISQTYVRNYKDIRSFDVEILPAAVVALKSNPAAATEIEIKHGITEFILSKETVDFQPDGVFLQDVLAQITQSVIRTAKLGCKFTDVYPIVEKYAAERFFDVKVNLNDPVVARALARHDVGNSFVKILAEQLGKHATKTQKIQLKPEPIRLSETHTFTWRRLTAIASHTIFNQVACYNQFEADFASFLDKAPDVTSFAKLAEWFTGFGLEYLSANGSVRVYYPDFVARVEVPGQTTMWLLETKGREDFDSEVLRKDANAEWWCSQVSEQTGITWQYAKLPYRQFHGNWPTRFANLIEMLKPTSGMKLIFELDNEPKSAL